MGNGKNLTNFVLLYLLHNIFFPTIDVHDLGSHIKKEDDFGIDIPSDFKKLHVSKCLSTMMKKSRFILEKRVTPKSKPNQQYWTQNRYTLLELSIHA